MCDCKQPCTCFFLRSRNGGGFKLISGRCGIVESTNRTFQSSGAEVSDILNRPNDTTHI